MIPILNDQSVLFHLHSGILIIIAHATLQVSSNTLVWERRDLLVSFKYLWSSSMRGSTFWGYPSGMTQNIEFAIQHRLSSASVQFRLSRGCSPQNTTTSYGCFSFGLLSGTRSPKHNSALLNPSLFSTKLLDNSACNSGSFKHLHAWPVTVFFSSPTSLVTLTTLTSPSTAQPVYLFPFLFCIASHCSPQLRV